MLKSLDILIGLSVVMLIVSMAVTLVNQAILNALAKKGRCLRDALAELLQRLDWKLSRPIAEDIAAMVLTQPSVRKTKVGPVIGSLFPALQFGEVIHREELTKTLLGFGPLNDEIKNGLKGLQDAIDGNLNGASQQEVTAGVSELTSCVQGITGVRGDLLQEIEKALEKIGETENQGRQQVALDDARALLSPLLVPLDKMVAALTNNGIPNPGNTLDNVRMTSLQLEKSNPEQANDVRHSTALLQEASSPFLAKINFGFDQAMDRAADRYTNNARIITLFSAALVAIVLQLDTVYLFNRLSMDEKMRDALVSQAAKVVADSAVNPKPIATPAPATEASEQKGGVQTQLAQTSQSGASQTNQPPTDAKTRYYLNFLAQQGVIRLPATFAQWKNEWTNVNYAGVLLSILLLSMGAPFWYQAICKLLQIRSLLAQKDDDQRLTRQTTQAPETPSKPGAPPTASPPARQGERGDLNATA